MQASELIRRGNSHLLNDSFKIKPSKPTPIVFNNSTYRESQSLNKVTQRGVPRMQPSFEREKHENVD